MARARRGDHESFRVLVERYQGRVHRLALRVLRDEELARDAVQEAFLKAYRSLARFEGRAGFYTWLYRLVLNLCLDWKRRDRSHRHVEWEDARRPQLPPEADEGAGSADGLYGPADEAFRKELRERVAAAIDRLPETARETLVLREVEGMSYAEIAEALDVPKGTVMSRLHYARKRVQQVLLEQGVVESRGDPGKAGSDA